MIGERLRKLRGDRTQSDFAKEIDVARTTYAMYEQNNREPDYETLQKIANFYNVTTDYLLERTDNPTFSRNETASTALDNDTELSVFYREILEADREEVRKLRNIWEIIKN